MYWTECHTQVCENLFRYDQSTTNSNLCASVFNVQLILTSVTVRNEMDSVMRLKDDPFNIAIERSHWDTLLWPLTCCPHSLSHWRDIKHIRGKHEFSIYTKKQPTSCYKIIKEDYFPLLCSQRKPKQSITQQRWSEDYFLIPVIKNTRTYFSLLYFSSFVPHRKHPVNARHNGSSLQWVCNNPPSLLFWPIKASGGFSWKPVSES